MLGAGGLGKVTSAAEVVGMEEDGIVRVLGNVAEDVCGVYDVFLARARAEVGVDVGLRKENGGPEFMVNWEGCPCFRKEKKGGAGE